MRELREKKHKTEIEETLEQRVYDKNRMVKEYNEARNVLDQDELREIQSKQ